MKKKISLTTTSTKKKKRRKVKKKKSNPVNWIKEHLILPCYPGILSKELNAEEAFGNAERRGSINLQVLYDHWFNADTRDVYFVKTNRSFEMNAISYAHTPSDIKGSQIMSPKISSDVPGIVAINLFEQDLVRIQLVDLNDEGADHIFSLTRPQWALVEGYFTKTKTLGGEAI